MYLYIYTYKYIYIYTSIYLYRCVCLTFCLCSCMYLYTYAHMCTRAFLRVSRIHIINTTCVYSRRNRPEFLLPSPRILMSLGSSRRNNSEKERRYMYFLYIKFLPPIRRCEKSRTARFISRSQQKQTYQGIQKGRNVSRLAEMKFQSVEFADFYATLLIAWFDSSRILSIGADETELLDDSDEKVKKAKVTAIHHDSTVN